MNLIESLTFFFKLRCCTNGNREMLQNRRNQHGGRGYDDLHDSLDMTSHENSLQYPYATFLYILLVFCIHCVQNVKIVSFFCK